MNKAEASPVAVITGSGRGIGRAFALRFARDGFRIVVADLDARNAAAVRAEITAAAGNAIDVELDVSREADCRRMVDESLRAFGRIDVLINDAAVFADLTRKPFWEIDVAEWDRVMEVNARGTWLAMKAVVPAMREAGRGCIINMSSNTFLAGRPGMLHYVASKGAVVGITRVAARELGEFNIRVNCILPGLTQTGVARASDDPKRHDELVGLQSLKRIEVADDLVGTAAFLASDGSRFMTGQALTVDGGYAFH
ncbi:MAG TPA: glucose 1-dehydrogenase [Candidatus Acidoferrales bacterium]|nr:glucose 1-dehydrogenase [Candidatus Acidoferrales bacterium]